MHVLSQPQISIVIAYLFSINSGGMACTYSYFPKHSYHTILFFLVFFRLLSNMVGDAADFKNFEKAVSKNKQLRRMSLTDCSVSSLDKTMDDVVSEFKELDITVATE